MKLRHYKDLDGVRGIAALMVMCLHFSPQIPSGDSLNNFLKRVAPFGGTGVTLFFVLSGFLITRILLNSKKDNSYFKTFYFRRSVRIFPLYYLFLIITFLIIPAFTHAQLQGTWYFWIYLQNFAFTFGWPADGPNHFWSLAVEEHFYLFWPVVLFFCSEKTLYKVIAALIIASLLCRILLLSRGYGVFYFTFTNMDALAIGALASLYERRGIDNQRSTRYLVYFFILMIPSVALGLFVSGKKLDVIQVIKLPLMAFAYYFLIVFLISLKGTNLIKTIFSSSPLTYFGRISYGLYVFHPTVFGYLWGTNFITRWPLKMLFEFGVSIALASLSYYLFELQFLKLKDRYRYHTKQPKLNLLKTETAVE
jgi:peptidoglycan/LPS O-acetylase OafA/YrhL